MKFVIMLYGLLLFPVLLWLQNKDIAAQRGKVHLYGIYGFFGLPGYGKTISMTRYLNKMRKKYGDKIYIMTNYHYVGQDIEFTTWRQLLQEYDKPLIVAWDEVQNEFNSRDFKDFPINLLTQLTQVRKGNGIQLLYTSQRWHFVDKNFRTLSFGCYDCHTIMGRYTYALKYDPDTYDDKCNQKSVDKKMRCRASGGLCFVQTDTLRNSFDSYKMLATAKSKQYMSRTESKEAMSE